MKRTVDLPTRDGIGKDNKLKPFAELKVLDHSTCEIQEEGKFHRLLEIDQATGNETIKRFFDSGLIKHTQTGLIVRVTSKEEC